MKRTVCLIFITAMVLLGLVGCNKMPTVDKTVQPEEIFSHYKKLTDQYGLSMSRTLAELDIDPQTVINNNQSYFGIPWSEEYGGIEFSVALNFGTGEQFTGVRYEASYQYPNNEEQLLKDIVTVSNQLISDFGEKLDATYTFNWVEAYLKEAWDRDIHYWEDVSVLKRLLDEGYTGPLLTWDITPVSGESVQSYFQENYGKEGRHTLVLSINLDKEQGLAYLDISY